MSTTSDLSFEPTQPLDCNIDGEEHYPVLPISSLPIIDISAFTSPSTPQARQETAAAINRACIDYGFFYLTGHGIPTTTLDTIISQARQFFLESPLSEKIQIKRRDAGGPHGGDGARGYQGMGENITLGRRDVQEAVDLYREWDHEAKTVGKGGPGTHQVLQGPNLWPLHPKELKPTYESYISQVKHVGEALVRAMGQALELGPPLPNATASTEDSEVFVRNTDHSFWVMRMIGYPKLAKPLTQTSTSESDITEFSCGEHTDYGCVTLLLTDPTPGALQVLLKDSKTWLAADPIPGAFVVNIGDMIERWTNGLWKSTRHRVIHRGEGYRVSVPFFYEPNFNAMVRPLGKCVERTGGERIHQGNTYGEHLMGKVFNNFYKEEGEEEEEEEEEEEHVYILPEQGV
ncbi:Clavaminate synthase-like protein [Amniculicola lignicola CBS 123094]|uniref:Clavaminate synthase-like protein n=1 Tax=Amniculicola lignicola CBS 123094 TaxID=1392246 RepID=A0A6A5WS06_9PLEO|nr:Clavaminate synthase-like protein [Amniculicola lignicola CBS 123094]